VTDVDHLDIHDSPATAEPGCDLFVVMAVPDGGHQRYCPNGSVDCHDDQGELLGQRPGILRVGAETAVKGVEAIE
jgi:hypothetical protein